MQTLAWYWVRGGQAEWCPTGLRVQVKWGSFLCKTAKCGKAKSPQRGLPSIEVSL